MLGVPRCSIVVPPRRVDDASGPVVVRRYAHASAKGILVAMGDQARFDVWLLIRWSLKVEIDGTTHDHSQSPAPHFSKRSSTLGWPKRVCNRRGVARPISKHGA